MSQFAKGCALCGSEEPLCDSHIIPKFVFRWMKDTGGTNYLRFGRNMNKRVQDGPKLKLLCKHCEGTFSGWEKTFKEVYFTPATKKEWANGNYKEWLSKFCASVIWRAAIWQLEEGALEDLDAEEKDDLRDAIAVWRDFLNGDLQNPKERELHLLPIGEFSRLQRSDLPGNWNRYTRRYVECDYVCSDSKKFAAIFVKMGPVALFGHVRNKGEKWVGSRMSVSHGNFVVSAKLPSTLLEYFFFARKRRPSAESNN